MNRHQLQLINYLKVILLFTMGSLSFSHPVYSSSLVSQNVLSNGVTVILTAKSSSEELTKLSQLFENFSLEKTINLNKGDVYIFSFANELPVKEGKVIEKKFCAKVNEVYGEKAEVCELNVSLVAHSDPATLPCPPRWLSEAVSGFQRGVEDIIDHFICDVNNEDFVMPARDHVEQGRKEMEGLSTFWAQERIGEDLALEFMQQQSDTGSLGSILDPVVLDTNFSNDESGHGSIVGDIIHQGSFGSDTAVHTVESSDATNDFIFQQQLQQGRLEIPSGTVVNRSMGVLNQTSWSSYHLGEQGYIPVQTAGNDYPFGNELLSPDRERVRNMVIVGSSSPHGGASTFSSPADVTIYAPSDYYLNVDRDPAIDNVRTRFSGTSGAAPLVSSSIINLQSLVNNQLDVGDVRELLQRTASPTLESLLQNGAGELNHFKLVRVGQRLRQRCLDENGEIPSRCLKDAIQDESLYDFVSESSLDDVADSLPGCDTENYPPRLERALLVPEAGECLESHRELFNGLRREALLNPTIENYRCLAGIYHTTGQTVNAHHYAALASAMENPPQLLFPPEGFDELTDSQKVTAFTNQARLTPQILEEIDQYLEGEALQLALTMPPSEGISSLGNSGLAVLRRYLEADDDSLVNAAVEGLAHMATIQHLRGEYASGINFGGNVLSEDIASSSRRAQRELDRLAEDPRYLLPIARNLSNIPSGGELIPRLLEIYDENEDQYEDDFYDVLVTNWIDNEGSSNWRGKNDFRIEPMRIGLEGDSYYRDRMIEPLLEQLIQNDRDLEFWEFCNQGYCQRDYRERWYDHNLSRWVGALDNLAYSDNLSHIDEAIIYWENQGALSKDQVLFEVANYYIKRHNANPFGDDPPPRTCSPVTSLDQFDDQGCIQDVLNVKPEFSSIFEALRSSEVLSSESQQALEQLSLP